MSIIPKNEKEKELSEYWMRQGVEHAHMSMETRKEFSKYVSFSTFCWITGVLMAIFSGINGVLYAEIGKMKGELEAYKSDMSKEISIIKINTANTQKDVEWIKQLFESKIVEF